MYIFIFFQESCKSESKLVDFPENECYISTTLQYNLFFVRLH